LPETTHASKLAMPFIIYPIVIKFYTNCDIFIASRRPQSNTYRAHDYILRTYVYQKGTPPFGL
jgi:hypothetical protein